MELSRSDQSRLSDDGLAVYHCLQKMISDRQRIIEKLTAAVAAEQGAPVEVTVDMNAVAQLVQVTGRVLRAPLVSWQMHQAGVILRIDDQENPEEWHDVSIPARALAALLMVVLASRPRPNHPLLALLSMIDAK